MTNRHKFFGGAAAALLLGAASAAHAANTFTAVSGNDWNTDANWSAGHVPADGEDVVVNGNVLLTNATAALASYTLNSGKTHTFDGWYTVLSAAVVNVTGTLTHTNNLAATTNEVGQWVPNARIWVVCSNLTVAAAGKIDVTAKGFAGGLANTVNGKGPGGGTHRVGGGHGGRGGRPDLTSSTGITYGAGGVTYDSPAEPEQPGSGGGGGDAGKNGGKGGGAVRIEAVGDVTVDGQILATGGNGDPNHGAGGSGGSVLITCSTLSGSGAIRANGGDGANNTGGGGGGGCVFIDYNPAAQGALPLPKTEINAAGGNASYNPSRTGSVSQLGEPGTLAFPDNQLLTRVTAADVVKLGGRWMDMTFTEWNVDALTLQNAWLSFPQSGFHLNVTNNVVILGTDNKLHRLDMTNGVLTCGGNLSLSKASYVMYNGPDAGASLVVGGDLLLTNASSMFVYCPPLTEAKPDYTALIDVNGTFTIAAGSGTGLTGGSWVYPYSDSYNGGNALFDIGSLRIMTTNAGFDANVKGYYGGLKNAAGYGPGAGNANVGGGHGGSGGFSATKGGGQVNDSKVDPVLPGSGGGGGDGSIPPIDAGSGGGVVRIASAGPVLVNGSILANGGNGFGNHGGGGAGGSISISCTSIHGTNGVLSAIGGNGNNVLGGGGGGGRISVRYSADVQAAWPVPQIFMNALGGTATLLQYSGEPGTLYFPDTQLLLESDRFLCKSGKLEIPDFTSWDLDQLAVSNAYVVLPNDFVLTVTNDLVISGTAPAQHKLVVSGGAINCGNLRLDKNVALEVYGDATAAPEVPGAEVNVSGDMTVSSNAWVYPYSHPTNGGSVKFTLNTLTLAAYGGFDANGKGFMGGTNGSSGFGPGRGISSSAKTDRAGGGGYGGQGSSVLAALGGSTYGSESLPLLPGSGGGAQLNSLTSVGGAGGGLVWVDAAGSVLLNGTVNANGANATGNSGAGSGGGVYIHCSTFNGTGAINANGGTSYVGGGGGRIAVVYTNLAAQALLAPSAQFSVASSAANGVRGDHGTLYFPDATFFPYEVIQGSYRMVIPTLTSGWSKNSLTVTNGEVRFPPGCALQITNSLTVGKGGILICTNNAVSCGGNLCVTNGGLMHVYAMPTNGAAPAYGMLVAVTGTMFVAAGSTNYVYSDPANGGSVFFDVGGLIVQSNAMIDANSKGFAAGSGRGTNGFGPGCGIGDFGNDRGGGGGYGGVGATSGSGANATGGVAYGSAYLPLLCGSGGGGKSNQVGSPGGGLIWMRVRGDAVVDGLLSANGGALNWTAGDGSGGGIFLDCDTFAGKGKLSADGGITANPSGANGGGGRIAVWVGVSDPRRSQFMAGDFSQALITSWTGAAGASYGDFIGAATATNGPYGSTSQKAAPGSIVFLTVKPVLGTLISVR